MEADKLNLKSLTEMVPVDAIVPYEFNPRDSSASTGKVAASISRFGFLQPIVVDKNMVIVVGHNRYQAALDLGLAEVPVVIARHLTDAEARAYRLADNKAGEGSKWIQSLLEKEICAIAAEAPEIDLGSFGIEGLDDEPRSAWTKASRLCDLTRKTTLRTKCGFLYASFMDVGKQGRSLEDIKGDPEMVAPFASDLVNYVRQALGPNLAAGGWCMVTTPRRRHAEGPHFATSVCEAAAEEIGVPFYPEAVTARNRQRINPEFSLEENPAEPNVILYDDILTTGMTIKCARDLLTGAGHNVVVAVAIRNGSVK